MLPYVSRSQNYRKNVRRGYEHMKQKKVAICGLARDCQKRLKKNMAVLEKLRTCFSQSYVVVVENDSKDGTKDVLKRWAGRKKDVYILTEDSGQETIPAESHNEARPWFSKHRMELMVKYRNKYLEFVEKNFTVDYLIIVDMDLFHISLDGIADTFGQPIAWDAVTSNGRNVPPGRAFFSGYVYFDTYALREVSDTRPQTEEMIFAYQYLLKPLKKGMPMMRVASAFNGLAVYRKPSVEGLRYHCLLNADARVEAECDHVSLHRDMARQGKGLIFINPSQIVYYDTYTNHIFNLFLRCIWKLKIKMKSFRNRYDVKRQQP